VTGLPKAQDWWVGDSLLEGVLPLGIVIITFGIVHVMTAFNQPVEGRA